MSSWVHVIGNIRIEGTTKEGVLKIFNLKDIEEYWNFLEDTTKYKLIRSKRNKDVYIRDFTKEISNFIQTIETPHGSEDDLEVNYCLDEKHIKIWGNSASTGGSAWYNKETKQLKDTLEDGEDESKWERCWEENRGEEFSLCISGDLRHSDENIFEEEFNTFIEELKKYFDIRDMFVKAICWGGDGLRTTVWEYNEFKDTFEISKYFEDENGEQIISI